MYVCIYVCVCILIQSDFARKMTLTNFLSTYYVLHITHHPLDAAPAKNTKSSSGSSILLVIS